MSDISAFKALLQSFNIQTRLVSCEIDVSIGKITSDNKALFVKEFNTLAQAHQGAVEQWLNKVKSKHRTNETDEVLLELMLEIYRKVEHIEQILESKHHSFIPLDTIVLAVFVGHTVLCVQEACFEVGAKYYARLFLPIFPQRHIGVFAVSPHPKILQITRFHHNDVSDFDTFVAQRERAMILDAKSLQKE